MQVVLIGTCTQPASLVVWQRSSYVAYSVSFGYCLILAINQQTTNVSQLHTSSYSHEPLTDTALGAGQRADAAYPRVGR